jgi:hypothetical protein
MFRAGGDLEVAPCLSVRSAGRRAFAVVVRQRGRAAVQGSGLEPDILHHIAETQLARRQVDQARDTWLRAQELYAAQHRVADVSHVQRRLEALMPSG